MDALDALTLSVIQSSLQQVCDEMDLTFSRAAFSPVIAEANDRSDGIYSAVDGALIELGFHDSSHDAPWLLDPEFAEAAARAIVEGLLAWRSEPDP